MKSRIYIALFAVLAMACSEEDLKEDATVSLTDMEVTIAENPTNGQVLGSIGLDVTGGEVTFSIESQTPDGAFDLDPATGSLIVADSALFDFEVNPTLTAEISGAIGEIEDQATVTVTLTDVASIVFAEDLSVTIDENPAEGTVLGSLLAEGDEGPLSYAVVSQSHTGAIVINSATGEVSIGDATEVDYEVTKKLSAEVSVSSGSTTATVDVNVNLNNVAFDQVTVSGAYFSERQYHQAVVFDDKLWIIGGSGANDELYNDVWYSIDGKTWTKETIVGTHFSARDQHQVVVYDDKIWVIAGSDDDGQQDDVWSSTDGATWTEVLASTSNALVAAKVSSVSFRFSARGQHQVVVFDDAMWLIGGSDDGGDNLNDIYTSTNGTNWVQKTPSANVRTASNPVVFSERNEHQVIAFDSKLWVIGGYDDAGNYNNDIWSTTNGTSWTQHTATDDLFTGRSGHRLVVHDSKLWLIGGRSGALSLSDIWYTTNGTTWEEVDGITGAHFTGRYRHQAVAFKNNIWFVGGYSTGESGYENDIWTMDN